MAFGNVYIFNLYVEGISAFDLNGQGSIGRTGSPTRSGDPAYSAPQLVGMRTNLNTAQLNSPLFVNGQNQISINYGGDRWSGSVTIPGPPQLSPQADLWLYIGYKVALLFDSTGNLLNQEALRGSFD
jgi:hypothetical protein